MRTAQHRVLISLAATIIAAACGMLVGYLAGRAIALNLAKDQLEEYATRIMNEGEASSAESRAVLAKMNSSSYPRCSKAEQNYFRKLIFQSEYLRDAGRMQDDKILCSTTLGLLKSPLTLGKANFSQQDGTKVYRDAAPFRVGNLTVVLLQLGQAYVVFSPHILMHLGPSRMSYTVTVIDAPSQHSGRLLGASPPAKANILTKDGETRLGDTLYATSCSVRFFNCITTFISIQDALRQNLRQFAGYVLLGAAAGGLFGLVISLLYRRNRSMENQILRAVRDDKLHVVYQPIVELASRRTVGAESLVRWTADDGVAISPNVFIKIMEERGLVGETTKLVIRHALRDFGETMRSNPAFWLTINLSAADLTDPGFLPMLDRSIEDAQVRPECLGFEITESGTARQQVAMDAILNLRQRGHHVYIDDFGTGYSSLAYLHDLSVDGIKIDKPLLRPSARSRLRFRFCRRFYRWPNRSNWRLS